MSQIVFIKWLECLRLCLQSSGRVSGHVYRLVGVSQVVCTQWWVCLGSCLQGGERVSVQIVFTWWRACLCSDRVYRVVGVSLFRSCLQGGGRASIQLVFTGWRACLLSGRVNRVVDVSKVMCLQGDWCVSRCVCRVVGVSRVVFTGLWACLSCVYGMVGESVVGMTQVVFKEWWVCLKLCL